MHQTHVKHNESDALLQNSTSVEHSNFTETALKLH